MRIPPAADFPQTYTIRHVYQRGTSVSSAKKKKGPEEVDEGWVVRATNARYRARQCHGSRWEILADLSKEDFRIFRDVVDQ